jgi:hypothetical protein
MHSHHRAYCLLAAGGLLTGILAACTSAVQVTGPTGAPLATSAAGLHGIHKIQHVIIVMQENRSFDSYFGTYPGADGIPMQHGVPTVCVPGPEAGASAPYRDTADISNGGRTAEECHRRHQPRPDERLPPARPGRPTVRPRRTRSARPEMRQDGDEGATGGDPELGLRQTVRATGPHVRAGEVVVVARPPAHGVRMVSRQKPEPHELREQHRRSPDKGYLVGRAVDQRADYRGRGRYDAGLD